MVGRAEPAMPYGPDLQSGGTNYALPTHIRPPQFRAVIVASLIGVSPTNPFLVFMPRVKPLTRGGQ